MSSTHDYDLVEFSIDVMQVLSRENKFPFATNSAEKQARGVIVTAFGSHDVSTTTLYRAFLVETTARAISFLTE